MRGWIQRLHEEGTKRGGPLFHRTDVVLMVKGSVAFLASLNVPRRHRTWVPAGGNIHKPTSPVMSSSI